MSSYAEIANRAAVAVGTSARLTAPGDDTVLGRAVAAVWNIERRAAIRDGGWNFAMRRATLPRLVERPKHGYSAQYELPSDCLKLVELFGGERLRYQLEGRQILADATGGLDIRYLADVAEPTAFDPGFVGAFALRIACAIGGKIAGSSFDKRGCWNEYLAAVADARGADALENPPLEQEESDWVLARYRGEGAGTLSNWVDGG